MVMQVHKYVEKDIYIGRFKRSKGSKRWERTREERRDGRQCSPRTIIFATKATSVRPQSEINSSRGLLTLSIILLAICGRYKYRRVKPTVFPTCSRSRSLIQNHNTWHFRANLRALASRLNRVHQDNPDPGLQNRSLSRSVSFSS